MKIHHLFAWYHFCEDIIIHEQDSTLDDRDFLNWPAIHIYRNAINLPDYIHSFQNLSKYHMFIIQMCSILMDSHLDKELWFIGVWT